MWRLRQLGIALALTTTTLGAEAAGLGRLNLMSGIGQPLRAEIELTAVTRDDLGSLTARLASPDAFGQAGIEYGSALSGLRFSIQRRPNGQPYVLVTSNQQVSDPYLDVLVELSWSSGRLVREYTMLLDPPETRAAKTEVDPGKTIVQAASPTAVTRTAPSTASSSSATSSTGGGSANLASPAPATARAPSSADGQYAVQSGDTAISIARANKPDNVSLEQMLAVLYRDNPQAFSGNINRLMAGATIKLPDAAAAQSVDGAEARRIVAQSANFGRYRQRIAQNAAEAPVARTGQQASGRLSTQVQDNSAAASDARDRLQLSRPDATRAPSTQTGPRSGASGPSVEELAAKDRELSETRTRLAQLEKSVADLQELLKLKNQTLADLQKSGPTKADAPGAIAPAPSPAPTPAAVVPLAPPAAPTPTASEPAVSAPPVVTPAPAAPTVVAATPAPAPAVVTSPEPTKAAPPPVAAAPGAEGAWYDSLLDNTLLLAGLGVLLLLILGYLFVTMQRRRNLGRFEDSIFVDNSVLHANSVFGTTGGQSVDTANSGFHSNFVPVAGALPEQSEVDPVAEADVYIAYGRDAQAEEILKEALRNDPARHGVRIKLLEIYAKRGDAKTFETMASEFYAATGGQGEEWKRAAALGASIDPRNPLYETAAATPAPPPPAAPSPSTSAHHLATDFTASDFAATTALPSGSSPPLQGGAMTVPVAFAASNLEGNAGGRAGLETSTDHMRTDPMPRPESPAPAPSMDLDFDLGLSGHGGVAPLQPLTTAAAPVPSYDGPTAFNDSQTDKPALDPFTASAFGGSDPSIRTAVNLPAFRARAEQPQPHEPQSAPRPDADGFTASDIFGSSIVADAAPYSHQPPPEPDHPEPAPPARSSDFTLQTQAFANTEPLDAFSNINLDLDDGGFGSAAGKTEFGQKTDVWQAMATKLDLALAYTDIGDKDGARELLEEVVRNGDQTQIDRARKLIGALH